MAPGDYDNCTAITLDCPIEATIYGFYPNLGANVFFIAIFGTLLGIQCIQALKWKTWPYSIAMTLGALVEIIGTIFLLLIQRFFVLTCHRLCRESDAALQSLVGQRVRNSNRTLNHCTGQFIPMSSP